MPEISSNSFTYVQARVNYPGDLPSYTSDKMLGYGGKLTWNPVGGFVISYDSNGGSGAPGQQTKIYGKDITLSKTVPVRDGCRFLGWADSPEARTALYQPGALYTKNESIRLFAVWLQYAFPADRVLVLPAGLQEIEEDAFCDVQAEAVLIPDRVNAIGDNAFVDIVIAAAPGSAAQEYAENTGLWFLDSEDFEIIPSNSAP